VSVRGGSEEQGSVNAALDIAVELEGLRPGAGGAEGRRRSEGSGLRGDVRGT